MRDLLLCSVLCHLNPTCSCVFHVSLHASDAKVEVLSFPIIYCAVCSLLFTADAELDVINTCVHCTAMRHLIPSHLNTNQAKSWHLLSSPRSTADSEACIEACVCCTATCHLISTQNKQNYGLRSPLPAPLQMLWHALRHACAV